MMCAGPECAALPEKSRKKQKKWKIAVKRLESRIDELADAVTALALQVKKLQKRQKRSR